MFEIKYDKNGQPLKGQEPAIQEEAPQEELQEDLKESDNNEEENLHEDTQELSKEEVVESDESELQVAPNSKEANFARLREKAERLERERDEALRLRQELEKRYAPKKEEPKEDDNAFMLSDDDLVEGKHLSKVSQKIKKLEDQIKQYEQKTSEFTVESKLKAQYPDFDSIVSPQNIARLREYDPDIAEAIHYTPDLYKKASLAYKMIKQLGIVKEDNFKKERAVAQKNAAKPKAMNSISPQMGNSPLSKANAFAEGLTDELKAQLRKEMQQARKNH